MNATVAVLWIPLGAGQHVVRVSGRVFEAVSARVGRRPAYDLYHSALVVTLPGERYVIEMTPVPDRDGAHRGVVAEGVVGSRALGRFRIFRYEIRRWRDGVIPDEHLAAATVVREIPVARAWSLLELVPSVPTPVWGRDELSGGEMWNSNSVTSWLLRRTGIDPASLGPPAGGRAPGWDAGLVVAGRTTGASAAEPT